MEMSRRIVGHAMRGERAEIHKSGLATVVVPAREAGINLGGVGEFLIG
jgi:hypothetical protein